MAKHIAHTVTTALYRTKLAAKTIWKNCGKREEWIIELICSLLTLALVFICPVNFTTLELLSVKQVISYALCIGLFNDILLNKLFIQHGILK
jgi:purine-cytosine permease-like protein